MASFGSFPLIRKPSQTIWGVWEYFFKLLALPMKRKCEYSLASLEGSLSPSNSISTEEIRGQTQDYR